MRSLRIFLGQLKHVAFFSIVCRFVLAPFCAKFCSPPNTSQTNMCENSNTLLLFGTCSYMKLIAYFNPAYLYGCPFIFDLKANASLLHVSSTSILLIDFDRFDSSVVIAFICMVSVCGTVDAEAEASSSFIFGMVYRSVDVDGLDVCLSVSVIVSVGPHIDVINLRLVSSSLSLYYYY